MAVKRASTTALGKRIALAGITAAAVTAVAPAFAEGDRFMYTVGDSLTYDDNLFRVPSGTDLASLGRPQRGDIINTSSIGMNINKQISRQSFSVDVQLSESRFAEYTYLNNSGQSLTGRWATEVGNYWKNDVTFSESKSLTSFVDMHNFQKNITTSRGVSVNASYAILPEWSLLAGAGASDITNSSITLHTSDANTRLANVGIQYTRPSGNQISLTAHRSDGRYPNQQSVFDASGALLSTVDNSYTQDDLSLDASWQLTGNSHLNGHTSLTRRRHREVAQRNFLGSTDSLNYNWSPAAKYSLSLALRRQIDAPADISASYVLTNGVNVSANWAPTGKVSVQGSLDWSHRAPQGDASNVIAGTSVEQDHIRTANLSVGYNPAQRVQLSLKLQNQQRDSTIASYIYTDNSIVGSASFSF